MLTMRVTPKISDSPALTKKRLDAAASPLSAWNATESRVMGAAALDFPSPQSKSAVGDFDHSISGPKPAYTRFRRGEGAFPQAQTRGDAPSPGICAKSAQIPTSPRKRGEVQAAAACDCPAWL